MSVVAWTPTSARYREVALTLRRTCRELGPGPLRVLDAGGGEGRDAVALALLGHDVTVLDSSRQALAAAREAAAAAGVSDTFRTVDADLDDVAALARITRHRDWGSGSYDLVLCHDVLPERGSTARVVADVAALTSSVHAGGAVSLLAPVGAPQDPALLGLDRDLVEDALLAAGCEIVHRAADLGSATTGRGARDAVRYWHLVGLRHGT